MTDRWTDSLSDYLDGELTSEDRAEIGRHLETCSTCAATLAELELVAERARSLRDREPERDLWPAIEARLDARAAEGVSALPAPLPAKKPRPRVVSFTWPELAAAGIAVLALSTATFWLGTRGEVPRERVNTTAGTVHSINSTNTEAALHDLRQALSQGREDLDTSTVRVLEQNLVVIERSITEARTALAADPGNPYLRRHLQETMSRKVSLMRQATFLASAP